MKKIILSLVLMAAAAISATAQISAGIGYMSKTYSESDYSVGGLYLNGNYTVLEIADGLQVTPGIALSILSGKDSGWKYNELNLGIPINLSYSFEVAEGFKLVPFLGPTIIFGLSNKAETGGVSVNLYDNDLGIEAKRLDLAVGGGLALDVMDIVRVSCGYNKGLLNRVEDADPAVNTSGIHFGVAVLF